MYLTCIVRKKGVFIIKGAIEADSTARVCKGQWISSRAITIRWDWKQSRSILRFYPEASFVLSGIKIISKENKLSYASVKVICVRSLTVNKAKIFTHFWSYYHIISCHIVMTITVYFPYLSTNSRGCGMNRIRGEGFYLYYEHEHLFESVAHVIIVFV